MESLNKNLIINLILSFIILLITLSIIDLLIKIYSNYDIKYLYYTVILGTAICAIVVIIKYVSNIKYNFLVFLLSTTFSVALGEIVLRYFGTTIDNRTKLEMVRDCRSEGKNCYPVAGGRLYFLEDEGTDIIVNGKRVYPITAGPANSDLVWSSETGVWDIFKSDEYGFRNPSGLLMNEKLIENALIGDSMTTGAAAMDGFLFADLVRKKNPSTVNLSVGGLGPIFQLGMIKDFLHDKKLKNVFWCYFEGNDLGNITKELYHHPFSRNYLKDDFYQTIKDIWPQVDKKIKQYVEDKYRKALVHAGLLKMDRVKYAFTKTELKRQVAANHLKRNEVDKQKINQIFTKLNIFNYLESTNNYVQRLILNMKKPERMKNDGLDIESKVRGGNKKIKFELFKKILIMAKKFVEQRGGKFIFVYLPAWERFNENELVGTLVFRNLILKFLEEKEIELVDIAKDFSLHKDPNSLFPFRKNGHYNDKGHKIVADGILKYLNNN